jgi:hypothetical protein
VSHLCPVLGLPFSKTKTFKKLEISIIYLTKCYWI